MRTIKNANKSAQSDALTRAAGFRRQIAMEEKIETTPKPEKAAWTVIHTWVSVVVVFVLIFGIVTAYQFNPDNLVIKFLWFALWLGVLPVLLISSYIVLARKNKIAEK
jgi:pheromone shutdown protein TraB